MVCCHDSHRVSLVGAYELRRERGLDPRTIDIECVQLSHIQPFTNLARLDQRISGYGSAPNGVLGGGPSVRNETIYQSAKCHY